MRPRSPRCHSPKVSGTSVKVSEGSGLSVIPTPGLEEMTRRAGCLLSFSQTFGLRTMKTELANVLLLRDTPSPSPPLTGPRRPGPCPHQPVRAHPRAHAHQLLELSPRVLLTLRGHSPAPARGFSRRSNTLPSRCVMTAAGESLDLLSSCRAPRNLEGLTATRPRQSSV